MTVSAKLKNVAAAFGYHVVRNHNNPEHTLMGLARFGFDTILDVGANAGQFAGEIRKRFPSAKLFCFEPVPEPFAKLSEWAAQDGRATAIQTALGDVPGHLEMFVHTDATPSSSLLQTTAQTQSLYPTTKNQHKIVVDIQRLDDWAAAQKLALTGNILLKIDVQGFETKVLRGAPNILQHIKAAIVEVNIEQLYEGQSRFSDIVQLFDAAGLGYAGNLSQACAADGRIVFVDAVFLRPSLS